MKTIDLFDKEICLLIILALGFALLVVPMPFARLNDDEPMYYLHTKHLINDFEIQAWRGSALVPFLLWAPALIIKDSLLSMRAVTVMMTLFTAILIYFLAKKLFDPQTALTSSLLYLFSFHILRYGIRVALDPFGAFFAILSLYFLTYRMAAGSGASFTLAAYSYQFWIPMFPLYLIQAYKQKLSLKRFISTSLIVALIIQAIIFWKDGLASMHQFIEIGGPKYVLTAQTWLHFSIPGFLQGWLEFSFLVFFPLLGLVIGYRTNPAKWLIYFVALQFLIISLFPSFAVYGGAGHWPYGLCPLLALVGGYGFSAAWKTIKKKIKANNRAYAIILLIVLLSQFILFNNLVSVFSQREVKGIHDLGYEYDIKAIRVLKEMDKGGLIAGQTTHGLLVNASRFVWGGGFFSWILELDPQLFMAYKTDVHFKNGVNASQAIQVVEVGPYMIISTQSNQRLSDYIEFNPSRIWALRDLSNKTDTRHLTLATTVMIGALALGFIFGSKITKRTKSHPLKRGVRHLKNAPETSIHKNALMN